MMIESAVGEACLYQEKKTNARGVLKVHETTMHHQQALLCEVVEKRTDLSS